MRTRLVPAAIIVAITTGFCAADDGEFPSTGKQTERKDARPVALTAEELAALPASLRQPGANPAVEKYRQAILKGWKSGSLRDGETASLALELRRLERAAEDAKQGA